MKYRSFYNITIVDYTNEEMEEIKEKLSKFNIATIYIDVNKKLIIMIQNPNSSDVIKINKLLNSTTRRVK